MLLFLLYAQATKLQHDAPFIEISFILNMSPTNSYKGEGSAHNFFIPLFNFQVGYYRDV